MVARYFESTPALVTTAINGTLFVRDYLKYGSFLGAMGNPAKRAEIAARMLAGEQLTAKTSEVWTARFAKVGEVMGWIGIIMQSVQIHSDNQPPWFEEDQQNGLRSGRLIQRSMYWGTTTVIEPNPVCDARFDIACWP
jgi:hypothetical protein